MIMSKESASNREATVQSTASQQFLRVHLIPDTTALLPVLQMTEVLNIPIAQILPIPHMPAWVMGVYNWRGEILWMVDLGHLLGLTPLYQQAKSCLNHTAIVIHGGQQAVSKTTGKKLLGLVVNRVEDMELCNPDSIQSPPQSTVASELVLFLRGYWLKSNGEILAVLDGKSIISRMPQPDIIATL